MGINSSNKLNFLLFFFAKEVRYKRAQSMMKENRQVSQFNEKYLPNKNASTGVQSTRANVLSNKAILSGIRDMAIIKIVRDNDIMLYSGALTGIVQAGI